ncbi:tetratricopeptide repeat protein [Neolewinella lacunae]|uniref:Tetratricopeptide repeat protein n=1 Tax=Neolewinella lacunae TaxID=1517758 RepID=A0A923PMZ6_9BACT|nr:tetratricopeptide repeat protein [Neolewinella lacunae]MBC6995691.1 tetratricopeptide repeat protein [Neolewinella lacunae]MDN3636616.1 tetratricopeptide repeat protein [Neolewinella lacunae]
MAKKNNIGRRPTGTPSTGRKGGTGTTTVEGDDTLVDIVEVRNQGLDFFERHRNTIVYGALIVAALVIGYVVYNTFVKLPAEKNAAAEMQQAQVQFERDSFALALTNPGQGFPGFLDIIDNYGSTEAGNLANYYAAVSYLNLGQYEAALDFAKSFKAKGRLLPTMKFGVIGDAESELGNTEAAMDAYQKAIDAAGDNFLTGGYYQNKVALLLRTQGRNEEALTAFRRLKSDFGQSPEAAAADKYIALLEAGQ